MPATGVRPPFLTLVAVRAIAPVAGMPPKRPDAMLAMPCADELDVGLVAAADHAVGHDGREQRLDRGEQRDGHRRREELADARRARRPEGSGAGIDAWISPKRDADRLDGQAERRDGGRRGEDRDDRRRNLARDLRPEQQDRERPGGDADRRRATRVAEAARRTPPTSRERARAPRPSAGRAGP